MEEQYTSEKKEGFSLTHFVVRFIVGMVVLGITREFDSWINNWNLGSLENRAFFIAFLSIFYVFLLSTKEYYDII